MKASSWKNVKGSSKKSPKCPNCGSWINHWKKLCGLDSVSADNQKCAVYACDNPAEDGAHIENNDVSGIYIAPMCHKCNEKDGMFTLEDKTILVVSNVSNSCGSSKPTPSLKDIISSTFSDNDKAMKGKQEHNGGWFY
jgi:hypothetical protein